MTLRTPRRARTLWLGGVALWVGIFPVLAYAGRLYYAEGGTSPHGPAMLMMAATRVGAALFPVYLAFLACFLLRYRGGASLLRVRTRSLPALALSAAAIPLSLFFLWMLFFRVDFWKPSRLPIDAYLFAWAAYFQYLRAAAVHRHDPPPDYERSRLSRVFA